MVVGINCQWLMHETTASALAYGIFKDLKKEFSAETKSLTMFVDIGASSYQVAIVTVLAAHYDENLGGRDFDEKIVSGWGRSSSLRTSPRA